jgi:hypothetical protein
MAGRLSKFSLINLVRRSVGTAVKTKATRTRVNGCVKNEPFPRGPVGK